MRKHIEGQRPFLFAAPCGHLSLVTRSVWPPEKFGKSVKTTEEEKCIKSSASALFLEDNWGV